MTKLLKKNNCNFWLFDPLRRHFSLEHSAYKKKHTDKKWTTGPIFNSLFVRLLDTVNRLSGRAIRYISSRDARTWKRSHKDITLYRAPRYFPGPCNTISNSFFLSNFKYTNACCLNIPNSLTDEIIYHPRAPYFRSGWPGAECSNVVTFFMAKIHNYITSNKSYSHQVLRYCIMQSTKHRRRPFDCRRKAKVVRLVQCKLLLETML